MKPAREAPYPTETKLSEACQKRIRTEHGGAVIKIHGSAAQQAGTPDLLICVHGRFIACELKQPGKKPTVLQMKRLRDWQAAGAVAGWASTEVELDALLAHAEEPGGWTNPALSAPSVD